MPVSCAHSHPLLLRRLSAYASILCILTPVAVETVVCICQCLVRYCLQHAGCSGLNGRQRQLGACGHWLLLGTEPQPLQVCRWALRQAFVDT